MVIPALIGKGREGYRSLERKPLIGFDGAPVAEASVTPCLLIHDISRRTAGALRSLPIDNLLDVFRRAADLFVGGRPDGLPAEDFVKNTCLTSGLPLSITRRTTIGLFQKAYRAMGLFLRAQSPGGLRVFDSNSYRTGGISVGLVPRGQNVGFVMPGNHPSTHFMWSVALAMKFPVVVRPSEDDLFTPYRLARALLEAGLPEEGLFFVPGPHELTDAIVQTCSLAVLFGMPQLEDRYAGQRTVKVYGPGRSKVVVTRNAGFERTVDMICRMVMDDAGRGCVNASAVIVESDARELASAVAQALARTPILSPLAEGARLAALRSAAEAEAYNAFIDSGLAAGGTEWTPGRAERVAKADGALMMRPTVIEVPSAQHPLFGIELPFPFVIFLKSNSREETLDAAHNSLVAAVAGDDESLTRELFLDPTIDKVYADGALSTEFDPREPHEGFLLDFLFEKKAFRRGKVSGLGALIPWLK